MKKSQTMSGTPAQIPWLPVTLGLIAAVAFWLTTKPTHAHFDYTYRIGLAFLNGHLGTQPEPPSWLNEMVPKDGRFYSVFPLGAVLSVLPVSVLGASGVISKFPGHEVAAAIIGLSVYFFFQLSSMERQTRGRRILLAFFPAFGTWIWCNLGFAGAWQIALGFALIGEVGALYFMFVRPQPVTAGAFFALAFGNRTELLLVMPVFLWLWLAQPTATKSKDWFDRIKQGKWVLAKFLLIPTALALLTAAYNYARFQSVTDFGYGHIPNVLQEPWYEHGLFSVHAIPWNVHKMLFEGFADDPEFPYVRFYPFGCSIFLASPFLCLIFREGGSLRRLTWTVIALLTFALWCHGNPGGWEFSYRYAILLIPWMFLLIVGNGPKKISATELGLFFISVAINAIATYEFLWTDRIHP